VRGGQVWRLLCPAATEEHERKKRKAKKKHKGVGRKEGEIRNENAEAI